MQIVIEISDTLKRIADNEDAKTFSHMVWQAIVMDAIKNGQPLPEGHGRLGDLDALETEMTNGIKAGLLIDGYEEYQHINDIDDCVECVRNADALIEADRGEE